MLEHFKQEEYKKARKIALNVLTDLRQGSEDARGSWNPEDSKDLLVALDLVEDARKNEVGRQNYKKIDILSQNLKVLWTSPSK